VKLSIILTLEKAGTKLRNASFRIGFTL